MPKLVDHDARRAELARAAGRSIATLGLAGVTLREIAAEAGCTTGALAHYFDGKEALLTAALQAFADATLQAAKSTSPTNRSELLETLDVAIPTTGDRAAEWRVWMWFWVHSTVDELLANHNRRLQQGWTDYIAQCLDQVIANEGLDLATPAHDLAVRLLQSLNGIGLDATFDPEAWPPARQRSQLALALDLLLDRQRPRVHGPSHDRDNPNPEDQGGQDP